MNDGYEHIIRNFGPVWDDRSRILILGSFPSPKSREAAFYYGHPQNRFWPLLASILGAETPQSVEEKKKFILDRHIALWDTLESCDIIGAGDSSIRNEEPVDICRILKGADIRAIFCNGATSHRLYGKHLEPVAGMKAIRLPSTSPANAAWSMAALADEWKIIKEYLY